jgi:hypothetical protein
MPDVEHFDAVILGSGQGGKLLAWHLGQSAAGLLWSSVDGSAAPVRRWPARRVRMKFGALESRIWPGMQISSA